MAEEQKTAAYAVLSPIRHDGRRYEPSDDAPVSVMLTETEAAELTALGCVGEMPAAEASPKKAGKAGD